MLVELHLEILDARVQNLVYVVCSMKFSIYSLPNEIKLAGKKHISSQYIGRLILGLILEGESKSSYNFRF
jgi:hypothetical protein